MKQSEDIIHAHTRNSVMRIESEKWINTSIFCSRIWDVCNWIVTVLFYSLSVNQSVSQVSMFMSIVCFFLNLCIVLVDGHDKFSNMFIDYIVNGP